MNAAPQEKGAQVQRMFSRITPRYDLLNRILSGGLDQGWRRRVTAMSRVGPGGAALDLCAGTGDLSVMLAGQVGPEGRAIGLDFCEDMLAVARRKYARPQLSFVAGDAHALPFDDDSFDTATMAFGLRNLARPLRAFEEMRRVVRPGGTVVVLELTRPRGWLQLLYYPYLFVVLPLVGGLISGDFNAYRYLARSIAEFLPPERVVAQMGEAGLGHARAMPVFGGIATIFWSEVI
jgi:demethylmenaquinone methyltransferase/2-methoxy-6-polyprenyl-1,4-benzoquinol methylase